MHECDVCIRQQNHGGDCRGKWDMKPCLIFERDPRGTQVYENVKIPVPFWSDIPEVNKDTTDYTLGGVDKTIRIMKIDKIEWDKNKQGLHGIILHVRIMYWSDENGQVPKKSKKPMLQVIKGGV